MISGRATVVALSPFFFVDEGFPFGELTTDNDRSKPRRLQPRPFPITHARTVRHSVLKKLFCCFSPFFHFFSAYPLDIIFNMCYKYCIGAFYPPYLVRGDFIMYDLSYTFPVFYFTNLISLYPGGGAAPAAGGGGAGQRGIEKSNLSNKKPKKCMINHTW
jgi:hypothetical protein